MSDHDILQHASKSLRDGHDGKRAGSGFTRARIMKTLHERRRRRLTWWFVLGPSIAALLGGSAWAQSTGSWPIVWQNISAVFPANLPFRVSTQVPEKGDPDAPRKSGPKAPEQTELAEDLDVTEPEVEDPEPAEPVAEPEVVEPELTEPPPPVVRRPVKRREPAVESSAAPEPAALPTQAPAATEAKPIEPPEPEHDPELRHFRKAHDLHYKQSSPRAAIAAYRDYLARYPSGRFVPEARYNIALGTLKLGRHDEAKRLLAPFAEGRYGSNRKGAAKALLDSLE